MRTSVPIIAILRLMSIIGIGNKMRVDLTCWSKTVLQTPNRTLANGDREFRISSGSNYRGDWSCFAQ